MMSGMEKNECTGARSHQPIKVIGLKGDTGSVRVFLTCGETGTGNEK